MEKAAVKFYGEVSKEIRMRHHKGSFKIMWVVFFGSLASIIILGIVLLALKRDYYIGAFVAAVGWVVIFLPLLIFQQIQAKRNLAHSLYCEIEFSTDEFLISMTINGKTRKQNFAIRKIKKVIEHEDYYIMSSEWFKYYGIDRDVILEKKLLAKGTAQEFEELIDFGLFSRKSDLR